MIWNKLWDFFSSKVMDAWNLQTCRQMNKDRQAKQTKYRLYFSLPIDNLFLPSNKNFIFIKMILIELLFSPYAFAYITSCRPVLKMKNLDQRATILWILDLWFKVLQLSSKYNLIKISCSIYATAMNSWF